MVMKALCLILITVKLTRMFAKKSNLIERTVSKVTLPYYNNDMTQEDLKLLVVTIKNTIDNIRVAPPLVSFRFRRGNKKASFAINRNTQHVYLKQS
jgi:hypothetical protein